MTLKSPFPTPRTVTLELQALAWVGYMAQLFKHPWKNASMNIKSITSVQWRHSQEDHEPSSRFREGPCLRKKAGSDRSGDLTFPVHACTCTVSHTLKEGGA